MVRFLADENFPRPSIELLRAAGHDVAIVERALSGMPDTAVLDLARRGGRTLLTFDRDFGELIFRHGYPAPPGIIFLRLPSDPPELAAQRVLRLLADPVATIASSFTILDADRERRRALPA